MSRENVEIVERIYERWERGDFSIADWADPAIDYAVVQGGEVDSAQGTEAMARSWRDWLAAFEEFKVEATEYIDRGDEILVFAKFRGRGKLSGVPVEEWPGASLFTLRDGKVVRLVLYSNRADALEALGLKE